MSQPLLFHGLAPDEVRAVLATARRRTFRRGEVVFHAGDPGESMQVIERGHLATEVTTQLGQVCILRIFGPGEVFGRIAVTQIEAVRSMTVVSLDDSQTFELFRNQLDALRAEHPSVNEGLLAMAGLELQWMAKRLLETLYVDADRRVRRRLLELGEQFRDTQTGLALIPLTQDQIAGLAGTSRATVNRVLAEEQRRGTIVKRRRTIALLDREELARWAGWPGEPIAAS